LISLIFGAFRQNISIKASYQSHQWDYDNELQHHSMMRNILRDNTLEMEKEIVQLQTRINYKKDFSYKVLKFLRLNADRVENIFIICFIVSLVFLIIHLLSKVPVTIK
jgi:NAD+--asparagine ADP-ribosyltransferase